MNLPIKMAFGLALLWSNMLIAADELAKELLWAKPFLNIVWRGELTTEPGKKMTDHSYWQRALNGQAIKVIHSVNDGEYGGESIIFYDQAKQSLAYYYFTTAGFYTHGTMHYDEQKGRLVAEELVENNAEGVTKVRSTSLLKAGELQTTAEYFKQGKWVAGHSATYYPSQDGRVLFK